MRLIHINAFDTSDGVSASGNLLPIQINAPSTSDGVSRNLLVGHPRTDFRETILGDLEASLCVINHRWGPGIGLRRTMLEVCLPPFERVSIP